MGSYRYEILRETTTDSLIMENNTREKKMNSNVYGIDLGTCNMKIYCKTSNKILNEKNTIALVKKDQIYAYGDAAYAMYEKAPETINVTFPVISGVIADFNNLQTMLQMYLEEHMKGKIRGAEFIVAVPTDITDVEKRAFFEMFYKSKLKPKSVLLCEKPIADAVGLGLDVNEPTGIMVVDIGADTTEISVISLGGLVIVGLYHLCKDDNDTGTNLVISAIHSGDKVPFRMAPLIFVSTLITHLFGGSAGREGAALQMGGSIGSSIGRVFRFDEKDKHVMIMCGMSAAFSALFGTPMAAAIFSMEMISVGVMYYIALVPCVISSLIAHGIASYFNVTNEFFAIENIPDFTILNSVKISVLAILCALVSILFCVALHSGEALYKKYLPNKYTRVFVGGCLVIIATMLVGSQTYNGTGMSVIQNSIDGSVRPEAFLLKIIFTALTLGAGYKGGEIVPSFFIGATFGCLFGNLTGFEPSLCAAVGMTSLFCGVTNCPITSLLISFELFGYDGMPYFLLAIPFSYMLSGYFGLYRSQKIVYSKYKTSYINKSTH